MIKYFQQIDWNQVWKYVETIYKIIPSIILTIFSLYFACRKVFHKLVITYDIVHTGYSQSRISNIIIYNRKDRIEVIKGINLIINNKYRYEVIKLPIPKIIKPFETLQLETEEITNYIKDFKKYNLINDLLNNKHYFEIITDGKVIKYSNQRKKKIKTKKEYKIIGTQRNVYNGVLINDHVKYAIIYYQNKIKKTAFVYEDGIIGGDWDFWFNAFKSDEYTSKDTIKGILENSKFKEMVESFAIDEIQNSNNLRKSF